MAEKQTSIKVGHVVLFSGYTGLEEGVTPILKDDERVMIMKIGTDEGGNATFEVRSVDGNGSVVPDRDGDTLFADEFKVLEPDTDAAPAAKPKRKAAKATKAKSGAKKKAKATEAKPKEVTATKAKKAVKAKPKKAVKKAAEQAVDTTEAAAAPRSTEDRTYTHDPAVKALLRKSNDIVEVARILAAQHEEIYFKLGGVLDKIHGDRMHVDAGYEDSNKGFQAYVDENVGGLGTRTAYYLTKIYRHFRQAGITSAQLKTIGWTKARALTVIPVDELDDAWLDKARNYTRNELEADIKSTYVTDGSGTDGSTKRTKYAFTLLGDANTLVEQALNHAKKQTEDGDANAAFELICTQYLTMSQDVEGAATLLPKNGDELVEYAVEKLGLDIDVVGPVESSGEAEA